MIIQLQSGSTVVGVGGGGGEGGTNLCSLKDGRRSLFLHGYVMYKKAYLRKTSSTSSSSNGHIPPDTKTNALSSPGIISWFELPSVYITSLFSRFWITA